MDQDSILPFHLPTTIGIFGPTMSGKSYFTMNLLKHANVMFDPPPKKIIYAYTEWLPEFDTFPPDVDLFQGCPTRQDVDMWSKDKEAVIVVLDDMADDVTKSADCQQLFTVGCHHRNVTPIYISQNVFHQNPKARTITLNLHHLILFKNRRDLNQIATLGRQLYPGKNKQFIDAYNKATETPYSYLLIDIDPRGIEDYRLRTDILPGNVTRVFKL